MKKRGSVSYTFRMKWDQRLFNFLETSGGVTSTNSGFQLVPSPSGFREDMNPEAGEIVDDDIPEPDLPFDAAESAAVDQALAERESQ